MKVCLDHNLYFVKCNVSVLKTFFIILEACDPRLTQKCVTSLIYLVKMSVFSQEMSNLKVKNEVRNTEEQNVYSFTWFAVCDCENVMWSTVP